MFKRVVTGKRTGRWFTGLRNFSSGGRHLFFPTRLVHFWRVPVFGRNLTADLSRLGEEIEEVSFFFLEEKSLFGREEISLASLKKECEWV